MKISVVVRSRDEADRLRLTLTSLSCQTQRPEVVVVNDGSQDHTGEVLTEVMAWLPLTIVTHATSLGRSAAANAGARAATGDILLFLDGDTLAAPDFVARHAAIHAGGAGRIARGETFHLRCTRFLADPETGTPQPAYAARLAALPPAERAALRVTRADILSGAIDRRAQPGIYPGAGPRRLYELELAALRAHPDCTVLWAAASGSNLSVRTAAFADIGGFDPALDSSEHRELALRLCQAGGRMVPADGARSYHMIHRAGWRDPLANRSWEAIMLRAHPIPAVRLLASFWAALPGGPAAQDDDRIDSLAALEAACRAA